MLKEAYQRGSSYALSEVGSKPTSDPKKYKSYFRDKARVTKDPYLREEYKPAPNTMKTAMNYNNTFYDGNNTAAPAESAHSTKQQAYDLEETYPPPGDATGMTTSEWISKKSYKNEDAAPYARRIKNG